MVPNQSDFKIMRGVVDDRNLILGRKIVNVYEYYFRLI